MGTSHVPLLNFAKQYKYDEYDFDKWMILLCVLSVSWKHDAWLGWIRPARAAAIQPVLLFLTRPSPYSSGPHIAATNPSPTILLSARYC